MRWKHKPWKASRTVRWFAILPVTIGNETRWLEYVTVNQKYRVRTGMSFAGSGWKNESFAYEMLNRPGVFVAGDAPPPKISNIPPPPAHVELYDATTKRICLCCNKPFDGEGYGGSTTWICSKTCYDLHYPF